MEYQFIDDPITGEARAQFSYEHQVLGPWLEINIGQDVAKLQQVLALVDDIALNKRHEETLVGTEYSITLTKADVWVQANASLEMDAITEAMAQEDFDYDQQESACCGSDDFRVMLLAWKNFINK